MSRLFSIIQRSIDDNYARNQNGLVLFPFRIEGRFKEGYVCRNEHANMVDQVTGDVLRPYHRTFITEDPPGTVSLQQTEKDFSSFDVSYEWLNYTQTDTVPLIRLGGVTVFGNAFCDIMVEDSGLCNVHQSFARTVSITPPVSEHTKDRNFYLRITCSTHDDFEIFQPHISGVGCVCSACSRKRNSHVDAPLLMAENFEKENDAYVAMHSPVMSPVTTPKLAVADYTPSMMEQTEQDLIETAKVNSLDDITVGLPQKVEPQAAGAGSPRENPEERVELNHNVKQKVTPLKLEPGVTWAEKISSCESVPDTPQVESCITPMNPSYCNITHLRKVHTYRDCLMKHLDLTSEEMADRAKNVDKGANTRRIINICNAHMVQAKQYGSMLSADFLFVPHYSQDCYVPDTSGTSGSKTTNTLKDGHSTRNIPGMIEIAFPLFEGAINEDTYHHTISYVRLADNPHHLIVNIQSTQKKGQTTGMLNDSTIMSQQDNDLVNNALPGQSLIDLSYISIQWSPNFQSVDSSNLSLRSYHQEQVGKMIRAFLSLYAGGLCGWISDDPEQINSFLSPTSVVIEHSTCKVKQSPRKKRQVKKR